LQAEKLKLRAIANSDRMQALYGRRVTVMWISKLVRAEPKDLAGWQRDADDVQRWCRGLTGRKFSKLWKTDLIPLCYTHPALRPTKRDQRFTVKRGLAAEMVRRFAGVAVPSRRAWVRAVRTLAPRYPARRVDGPAVGEAPPLTRRDWRAAVRGAILRYLWTRETHGSVRRRLGDLAERFGVSERTVRRAVLDAGGKRADILLPD
jgi:hypothetical protein